MTEWDSAFEGRPARIGSLGDMVPGYSYASKDLAHRTDEQFCILMVENIKIAKGTMFNVLHTAFELHRELLLKDFEAIKDEMDVFSDEIKARVLNWDDRKSAKWLGRLVDYDYRILSSLGDIIKSARSLHKQFLSSKQSIPETRELDEATRRLKKSLGDLVVMFKERELICNIGDVVLEKTFDELRTKIRRGI